MGDRTRRWAGVVTGFAALIMIAYFGLQDMEEATSLEDILGLIAVISPSLVGAYLVWRLPRNAVGWALAGFGFSFTLGLVGEMDSASGSLGGLGAWLSSWLIAANTVLILVVLPLRFPDGKIPSSSYRWVTPTAVVGLLLVVVANTLRDLTTGPTTILGVMASFGVALLGVGVAGAVTACVSRFRHSKGVERQQMKVFAAALGLAIFVMALGLAATGIAVEAVSNALFATSVLVLVGSIALAVLRYRLYDFDRIISRTVSYALLVLILGSIYVLGAVWLPTRLVGQDSPLFVAASTLAVAALFTPIRRVVMRWVDRRFNRSSYDAERVTEAFSARLRNQVDANRLAADWVDVVGGTVEPSVIGIWLRNEQATSEAP